MFCEKCGKKAGVNDLFCKNCGQNIKSANVAQNQGPAKEVRDDGRVKIVGDQSKGTKTNTGLIVGIVIGVFIFVPILMLFLVGGILLARKTANAATHKSNSKMIQIGLESNYAKEKSYCGTGALQCGKYSMAEASSKLGTTLSETKCTGDAAGGGFVEVNKDGYKIHVYDSGCSTELTESLITMP
jgi:hypothetical protein